MSKDAAKDNDRACLGVPGLDEALGCMPRGSIMIVAGYPGAGKTTLASQFIYQGLINGEPGLYVSFVEPRDDFIRNSSGFGLDFAKYEAQGIFKYYEGLNVSDPEALGDLLEDVMSQVDKIKVRRLVIDSVSAIEQLAGSAPRAREVTHSALYVGLKRRGVTSLLISEMPVGSETFGVGPEEFIADGIIVMKYRFTLSGIHRFLEIRKLRGVAVQLPKMYYMITESGVEVKPPLPISRLPSAVKPRRAFNLMGLELAEGSGTLIVYDPSLDPIRLTLWALAYPAAASGLRVRIGSYMHGVDSMRHLLEQCPGFEAVREKLALESYEASIINVEEADIMSWRGDRAISPELVIVDGIHVLAETSRRRDYTQLVYRTLVRRAASRITTIHTYSAQRNEVWSVPMSKYYDYVLYLGRSGDGLYLEPLRVWGSLASPKPISIDPEALKDCASLSGLGLKVETP